MRHVGLSVAALSTMMMLAACQETGTAEKEPGGPSGETAAGAAVTHAVDIAYPANNCPRPPNNQFMQFNSVTLTLRKIANRPLRRMTWKICMICRTTGNPDPPDIIPAGVGGIKIDAAGIKNAGGINPRPANGTTTDAQGCINYNETIKEADAAPLCNDKATLKLKQGTTTRDTWRNAAINCP